MSILDDKIIGRGLAGLVGIGFLAWSGAVWKSVETIDVLASNVNVRLAALETAHVDLERELRDNERGRPIAAADLARISAEVGALTSRMDRQMLSLQSQLDRIEARADAIANARIKGRTE